jgi:hypothetical protein
VAAFRRYEKVLTEDAEGNREERESQDRILHFAPSNQFDAPDQR